MSNSKYYNKAFYLLIILLISSVLLVNAQFGPSNTIFTGGGQYASAIISGDVDNDGNNDVVIRDATGTNLYRNLGGGIFSDPLKILAYYDFTYNFNDRLKILDIDNDGDGDIIKNSTWYRNNGTGMLFTIMGNYAPQGILASGLLKDINGDGIVDDIGCASNNIFILLNDGFGNFFPSDTIDSAGFALNVFAALEDVNADSTDDLVIGGSNSYSGIYMGIGNGKFGLNQTIINFSSLNKPEIGDMDGDSDFDLIAYGSLGTSWWVNDGSGTFTFVNTISSDTIRPQMVADVDGDNDLDFSINTGTSCDVQILQNDSGISFSPFMIELFGGYSLGGTRYTACDLNNDGDDDLIMVNPFGIGGWYQNNGNGSFGPRQMITQSIGWGQDLDNADIDLDGDVDLIAVSRYGKLVSLHLNNGNGTFGTQQIIAQHCGHFTQASFADMNMDGNVDVITNSPACAIIWNNGNSWTTDTFPRQIIGAKAIDIDGDLDPDLIGNGFWYRNNSNGVFDSIIDLDLPIIPSYDLDLRVNIADFNNDGFPDLILPYTWDTLAILLTNGQGDITTNKIHGGGTAISTGDFDIDGNIDIQTGGFGNVAIQYNNGNASFGNTNNQALGINGRANSLLVYDFDNDGDGDIVGSWSNNYLHNSSINRNTGFGNLGPVEPVPLTQITMDMLMVDINGDNKPDLVSVGTNSITWCENMYLHECRLRGSAFSDFNINGISDTLETKIPFQLIETNASNILEWTNSFGDYDIGTNSGTYNIWANPTVNFSVTNNPDTLIATVDSIQPIMTGLNFGMMPATDTSLVLSINTASQISRCNTECSVTLQVQNIGLHTPVGSMLGLFIHPDLTINSMPIPPDSISGDNYFWIIDSLGWFETYKLNVEITTGAIGSNSKMIASLSLASNQPVLQTDSIGGIITCAFDPNDKKVIPVGYGNYGAIDINSEWLTYTIRFQNTGNDTAHTVYIRDLLDPDLKWSTLTILGTSHPITKLSVDEFGLATFRFDNIMLPDSIINEAASHGYIKYRISPHQNASSGTEIVNKAHIHFDQNSPVITNSVLNTLVDCNLFVAEIFNNGNDSLIATAGENYQWLLNGDTLLGAIDQYLIPDSIGNYSVLVKSIFGCLAVSPSYYVACIPTRTSFNSYICLGDSIYFGNTFISADGIYNHTYIDMMGCDSLVTLYLNNSAPVNLAISNDTLIASPTGTYQWRDCINNTIIPGAVLQYFFPSVSGSYSCIVNQQGCVDTTLCVAIITSEITTLKTDDVIILPNPASERLTFSGIKNLPVDITINDISGKVVADQVLVNSEINISHLNAGVYFVTLRNNNLNIILRFVKNE